MAQYGFVGVTPLRLSSLHGTLARSTRLTKTSVVVPKKAGVAKMQLASPEVAKTAIGAYGVIVAGGGIGAFLKSGSKMSAISGGLSGLLLLYAYTQGSVQIALGTALALMAVFGVRLVKTKKFMPAGLLFIMSLAFAAYFGYTFLN